MRRAVALAAAVVLALSLSASGAAAGPSSRVNSFVGSFDMVDGSGHVVAHVVAAFKEPTASRLVPGTIDIHWAPYDVANPPFPFMPLDWPPVKESHAQLVSGFFGDEVDPTFGRIVSAGALGYLCDYTAPFNADCRPFGFVFQKRGSDPAAPKGIVGWAVPCDINNSNACDYASWYPVGKGVVSLTYVGPTGG